MKNDTNVEMPLENARASLGAVLETALLHRPVQKIQFCPRLCQRCRAYKAAALYPPAQVVKYDGET